MCIYATTSGVTKGCDVTRWLRISKYARAKFFSLSTPIDQMLLFIESVNFVVLQKDEKRNYGLVKC